MVQDFIHQQYHNENSVVSKAGRLRGLDKFRGLKRWDEKVGGVKEISPQIVESTPRPLGLQLPKEWELGILCTL